MKLVTPSLHSAVQEKFLTTRKELSAALIERDEEVDLTLTALIAQEHLLLVGAPGCAKSLLLDSVMNWMSGKRFNILLTKFTVPEEAVGPISLTALKEDRYRRVTTSRLPEADVAFIDEIWKASSAILNSLLKILNERVFENDGEAVKVPLKLCVAASNEWPSPESGKELSALFDRFLFRRSVRPIVSESGRRRLVWNRDHTPKLSTSVTPDEIEQAHAEAMRLVWTDQAREMFETILREIAKEGIRPGDRRQFKAVGAAQAFAYLCGSDRVEPEHLEVLASVLWDDPIEQPEKVAQIVARIANPTGMRVNQLLLECEQILTATDVRDLKCAATATTKLAEIEKQLATLRGNGRVEKAQIKRIKLTSIESI
jgi:MoxR-like ATPase